MYNLANKDNLVHNLFLICLFLVYQSLHISVDYVPIIRRNNCVCATLGTCYSVWMSGMQEHMLLHTRQNKKYQEPHKHSCFS